MTKAEIDAILESAFQNGEQSVKIGDAQVTRYSVSDLLKLREQIVRNELTEMQKKPVLKAQFTNE